MAALIFLVAVPISPPLDLLGFWIFRVEFLFVGFLFRFLIWFVGVFAFLTWIFGLLVVVFWMVSDDLVVGTCFFGSWWLFF